MNATITFRNLEPTEAIKDFVHEKLGKLTRYGDSNEAHVILSLERYLQNAEVLIRGKRLRATGKASTQDMYASIEEAVDKVEKTLAKKHDKKIKAKTHARRD